MFRLLLFLLCTENVCLLRVFVAVSCLGLENEIAGGHRDAFSGIFLRSKFFRLGEGLLNPYSRVQFIQPQSLSDIFQTPFVPATPTPIKPLPTLDAHDAPFPIPLHFVYQIHDLGCNRFLHFFFNLFRHTIPDLKNLPKPTTTRLPPTPIPVPFQIHKIPSKPFHFPFIIL